MDDAKYDKLKLNKQLCFPLYACARETIKLYTPLLEKLNLTYTQYITMMVLWEQKALTEYSAPPEQGVRRVRATIPTNQSQCSGQ